MNYIAGLQKTTLIDYPGHIACTVFTGGCNFRCPFCHNSSLVLDSLSQTMMSENELLEFLNKRKNLLDGVCFTGGEPLLHEGLEDLMRKTKDLGYLVKLDTNGSFPQKLEKLLSQGLIDYVAMDLKHGPKQYGLAIGGEFFDLKEIGKSVELLMAGEKPYEFRTTLVKGLHTIEDVKAIGQWIKGAKAYYLQNYQESKDTIASRLRGTSFLASFSQEELNTFVTILEKQVPSVQIRSL